MNIYSDAIWERLRQGPDYRNELVATQVKRSIPRQIRAMMKARGWKQADLAERSKIDQSTVSRALDPDYGNLTLNTIISIANGCEVSFIGEFVPFSDLARWYASLPEKELDVPTFEEEDAARREQDLYEVLTLPLRSMTADEITQTTQTFYSIGFSGDTPVVEHLPAGRPPFKASTLDEMEKAA